MKDIISMGFIVALVGLLAACSSGETSLQALAKPGVTGTIELAAATAERSAGPTYGSRVGFNVEISGSMAPKSQLYVTVVCLQNDVVVYQASADPDAEFALADQPGQGLEWDGGDAACSATLIYKVTKGKGYDLTFLDETGFKVTGG